ncbi:prepilin-type N-terminal cleavage/methylation domain-containing protein [Streptomyces sp. NPDC059083]|uniref:prepilin-type N-terminal cleavage/methylation domain-containing protein n=1 Tax=unclassified Streptomyces TaxID=2593676 RepID=UPI00369BF07B
MTPEPRLFSLRARRQDGFTLIELLVAIVILGVLAAVVVFSVRGIGDKGRENAVAADAATLRTAEETYCAKHGRYASIEELKADRLLVGEPSYNMVAVGNENKCGQGASSSFTLYDTSPLEGGAKGIPVGTDPVDLAVDEKADRVYVVASGSTNVTVIDGKTDTPLGAPIDVSGAVSNPTRIAVNTGTGQVYVGGTGGLAVIDTANANRVTHIDFAEAVSAVAVSPENGDVYVAGGTFGNSTVAYIAAGSAKATPIPLPVGGVAAPDNGTDFAFDPARHAVYLAKSNIGAGESDAAGIGLYAISSKTHEARITWKFRTKASCGTSYPGNYLVTGTVRGSAVVDPSRNLVYLLAQRCVPGGGKTGVPTTIVINPVNGTATPIDDPVGTQATPQTAVYSSATGSVYVYSRVYAPARCGGSAGLVLRIAGTEPGQQAPVCGPALSNIGNSTHKLAVLNSANRIFAAQMYLADEKTGSVLAPGGLGVADGTTLLTQAPLGAPTQFTALAVNNKTAKVYALDPAGTAAVFRTGSA